MPARLVTTATICWRPRLSVTKPVYEPAGPSGADFPSTVTDLKPTGSLIVPRTSTRGCRTTEWLPGATIVIGGTEKGARATCSSCPRSVVFVACEYDQP